MIALQASARDPKANVRAVRNSGNVPGVVYGFGVKELQIQCDAMALHKAFVKAGESTLVELDLDGKKVPVLFKEIQFDAITDREIHADFYAVNMKEEIETLVPLHIEGESLAVKDLGGIIVTAHDHVRVRCLPADLPHSLTVNISSLTGFHMSITVQDLSIPKGVKVMDAPETVLVTVQEPRAEEVIEPTPSATAEGAAAAGAEGAAPGAEGAAGAAPGAAAGAPAGDAAKKDEKKK